MFAGELIKSLVKKIPFSNGAILLISDLFKTNFKCSTFFSGLFNPALNGENK